MRVSAVETYFPLFSRRETNARFVGDCIGNIFLRRGTFKYRGSTFFPINYNRLCNVTLMCIDKTETVNACCGDPFSTCKYACVCALKNDQIYFENMNFF